MRWAENKGWVISAGPKTKGAPFMLVGVLGGVGGVAEFAFFRI